MYGHVHIISACMHVYTIDMHAYVTIHVRIETYTYTTYMIGII